MLTVGLDLLCEKTDSDTMQKKAAKATWRRIKFMALKKMRFKIARILDCKNRQPFKEPVFQFANCHPAYVCIKCDRACGWVGPANTLCAWALPAIHPSVVA
jgi:hypothetical protein